MRLVRSPGAMLIATFMLVCGTTNGDAATSATSTRAATTSCSVKGLQFRRRYRGFGLGVGVHDLRARGATCGRARHIATAVAKAELYERKVPKRIDGFRITVIEPSGCCAAPIDSVTAKRAAARVTFEVHGGG